MSEPYLGEIKLVGWSFAARGYALCNGQILAISTQTALFSLLGTTYGGNGQNTFALPNMQGRTPIHQGQSPGTSLYDLGEVAGTETVTLTSNQMPIHNHALTGGVTVNTSVATNSSDGTKGNPSGNLLAKGIDNTTSAIMSNFTDAATDGGKLGGVASSVTSTLAVGAAGGSMPFNILQPYLVVNFIIAVEGIFPSRN